MNILALNVEENYLYSIMKGYFDRLRLLDRPELSTSMSSSGTCLHNVVATFLQDKRVPKLQNEFLETLYLPKIDHMELFSLRLMFLTTTTNVIVGNVSMPNFLKIKKLPVDYYEEEYQG